MTGYLFGGIVGVYIWLMLWSDGCDVGYVWGESVDIWLFFGVDFGLCNGLSVIYLNILYIYLDLCLFGFL